MKKIVLFAAALLLSGLAHAQTNNIFSAGLCHSNGAPNFNPGQRGCRLALDTTTQTFYLWKVSTTWVILGRGVDEISGCSTPSYTPNKWQSSVVINRCTPNPEIYYYFSGSWHLEGGASGSTYTAGAGIDITGTVISNTGDLSNTNEIQRIDTLSLSGNVLSASLLNDGVPASTVDLSSLAPTQLWTDGTQEIYPTDITDFVSIGTTSAASKLGVTTDGLGVTQTNTSGIVLANNTAAAAGAQQISPGLRFRASGWKTTATAASQSIDFRADVLPVQGTTATTGWWQLYSSINGGAYLKNFRVFSDGRTEIGNYATTGLQIIPTAGQAEIMSSRLKFSMAGTVTSGIGIEMASGFGFTGGTLFSTATTTAPTGATNVDQSVLGLNGFFSGVGSSGKIVGVTCLAGSNAGLNSPHTGQIIALRVSTQSQAVGAGFTWRGTGAATYSSAVIDPIINQQAGATGNVFGIDYNPTLTSLLGAHYAMLIRSGQVGIGTATPAASALVDITSTTSGLLPPRMTTAQRDAIASPADGLIIFCTDCTATDASTGVSQTYSSSAWRNHY